MKPTEFGGIKMRQVLLDCGKTSLTTQRHTVSIEPKNWKLGECPERLKLSVFGLRVGLRSKKLEGFLFQERNTEN